MSTWTLDQLARLIDHTNLHADVTEDDMARLCDEAIYHHFKMVAVNQVQVSFCARRLAGTDIHTGAAIAFPLGQTSIAAKVFETRDALANGANEIDYVANLTHVRMHDWDYVADEMRQIVDVCDEAGVPSKVIFENCYLSRSEKIRLCEIAREVGPAFVKTSTGFGPSGATVEDVALMHGQVGGEVLVKAAGGIRDADTFLAMVRAGARRIGTSAGVAIIKELRSRMASAGVETLEP
ncbi:MAG: deoxyribose-phosphate aldolase [Acidobacteriota bacterium]|nr:deoxyribose-phosphate aldolase [Acidobacteriota bacterium]